MQEGNEYEIIREYELLPLFHDAVVESGSRQRGK